MTVEVLLHEAIQSVQASDTGHLSLELRGQLWRSMGPTSMANDAAVRAGLAEGHQKRLALLEIIAKYVVVPAWTSEVDRWRDRSGDGAVLCANEDAPPSVIAFAGASSTTTADASKRANRYGTFKQYSCELWDDAPRAVLCLEYAAGVLAARIRDLIVREDDYEEGNDKWKPDIYACWAYAGSTHLYSETRHVSDDEIEARRHFWRWYVGYALPVAMGMAPQVSASLEFRSWPTS